MSWFLFLKLKNNQEFEEIALQKILPLFFNRMIQLQYILLKWNTFVYTISELLDEGLIHKTEEICKGRRTSIAAIQSQSKGNTLSLITWTATNTGHAIGFYWRLTIFCFIYNNTYILFTIKRFIAWHYNSFC